MKRDSKQPARADDPIAQAWASAWFAPALLAVGVLIAFVNSLEGGLVLDNQSIIARDPRIQQFSLESQYQIWTRNYWWPTYESDLYRPLTTLSYWMNYTLLAGGENPVGYHVVNLLLHWLCAWLVWLLAARYLKHRAVALFLALAFAVHPLVIEAVTNIIGRADLFASVFVLAALELHARLRANTIRSRNRGIAGLAMGVCATLAVFTKESGIVLIALMLLDDLSQPAPAATSLLEAVRTRLRNLRWTHYACILPSIALLFFARYWVLRESPVSYQLASDNPMAVADFWTREMTAIKVLGYYVKLTLWPGTLSCDYSFNQIPIFRWTASGADMDGWIGLAVVVLLAVAALVSWRRLPAVFFFLGFAFITLMPVSNLVIPIGTVMAERFMYLPLVGLLGALAAVLERAAALPRFAGTMRLRSARWATAGLAGCIVLALAGRTVARNLDWHDNLRLWRSAMLASPNSFKVYKGMATSLIADRSKVDECIRLAERAVEIADREPLPTEHFPNGLLCDLARYYLVKGEQSLRAGRGEREAESWFNKAASVMERAMRQDEAVNAAARRAWIDRGFAPDGYHDVGLAEIYAIQAQTCVLLKRYSSADDACRWMARLKAGDGYAYGTWADTCTAMNEPNAAAVHLIQAIILGQTNPQTWAALQRIYMVMRPGEFAVVGAENGPALNPSVPLVRDHLDQACRGLVEDLLAAKYRTEAEMMRTKAIKEYKCPPKIFARLFEKPAETQEPPAAAR